MSTAGQSGEFRLEHDSMGEVRVPIDAYYGAQTQRAVENFTISGQRIRPELIHALGRIKRAAAVVNHKLGALTGRGRRPLSEKEVQALITACGEVAEGKFDDQFPIDVYQTGSGTSSNMNTNEVIANRANELAGYDRRDQNKKIHPNDHVNFGQSTNDMFPTAIHVACALAIHRRLVPALEASAATLQNKADQWRDILKIGRTHLADATPLSLGDEIGGLARQMQKAAALARQAIEPILELPAGGTAVGSGINTDRRYGGEVARYLAEETKIPFREAENHFEANAQRDGLVACHALLKCAAVTLSSVANNIRWLGSGPRCGFYEIRLADLQPGSSIMPGKVNPVLCESAMQAAAKVIGNDAAMALAGASGGQFQLNIMMPVMGDMALESITLLAGAVDVFDKKCLALIEPNPERCAAAIEQSLSMVTGLNLKIGYEKAAALAKEAFKTGKTIRQLCTEKGILSPEDLAEALHPARMAKPFS